MHFFLFHHLFNIRNSFFRLVFHF
uniref:Uncharacterized protein n=1 Tax=Rhizophora mucronata TaxID=61149 RepID=A0A2P2QIX3_RHIMU